MSPLTRNGMGQKRNKSFIVKFFSVLFVCMSLLYISFQVILLRTSTEKIALREKEVYFSALQNGNTIINEYFDGIGSVMFMLEKQIDLYGTDKLESFLAKYKSRISIFSKSVYFVDPDERVYCTDPDSYNAYGNDRVLDFHRKSKSSPSMGFSDPYISSISSETLAVYRLIMTSDGGAIGTIVVEIDLDYFRSRLKAALTPDSPTLKLILVTSYSDIPIAFFTTDDSLLIDPSMNPPALREGFLKSAKMAMINQETEMTYEASSMMVYYRSLIRAPFNLCLIAGEDEYRALFDMARMDSFLNISIGTLLIILAATLLTAFTTNHLRRFIAEMDKVDSLIDLKPITHTSNDEFGSLIDSYNALLARICGLIEDLKRSEHQKKMLELKILQSQIGPHFLHNTLACFGSLAKQGKLEHLREGIRNLILLLGYSFDRIDDRVKLEDEIRVLESYCRIQKLRYGDVFDVRFRIDPDTTECRLPKLILQPLVENAIFHGILPKYQTGLICVDSSIEDGKLVITIRDDGIGMNQEQVSRLFAEYTKTGFNKIGIKNVDERIKLNYGSGYGLVVASKENTETIVTLTLPAMT